MEIHKNDPHERELELLELEGANQAINKLDVMSSKQFNRLLVINIILTLYAFGHVIFLATCCATVKSVQGENLTYATCSPAKLSYKIYMMILYLVDILGRLLIIMFWIFFVVRVLRSKKRDGPKNKYGHSR